MWEFAAMTQSAVCCTSVPDFNCACGTHIFNRYIQCDYNAKLIFIFPNHIINTRAHICNADIKPITRIQILKRIAPYGFCAWTEYAANLGNQCRHRHIFQPDNTHFAVSRNISRQSAITRPNVAYRFHIGIMGVYFIRDRTTMTLIAGRKWYLVPYHTHIVFKAKHNQINNP